MERKYAREIERTYDRWLVESLRTASAEQWGELQGRLLNAPILGKIPREALSILNDVYDEWEDTYLSKVPFDDVQDTVSDLYWEGFNFGVTTAFRDMGILRKDLPESVEFTLTDDALIFAADSFIRFTLRKTTDTTLQEAQKTVVRVMFEERGNITDALQELRDEGISNYRADLISRTVTAAAIGKARFETFRNSGAQKKTWITVGDDRVRELHSLNESVGYIPIDQTYPSGAQHVGDGADAVGCRCVEAFDVSDPGLSIIPWDGSSSGFTSTFSETLEFD